MSERRACRIVGAGRSSVRYCSRRGADEEIRDRLKSLALERRRWGYKRLHILLRREGFGLNHKKTYRIYKEEGLSVRRRKRKRISVARCEKVAPVGPRERWSMDFISDSLWNGRRFRSLTIVDDFTREAAAIEVDTSLPAMRVIAVLERLEQERGLRSGSLSITDRSSPGRRSTPGPTRRAWSCSSFSPANRSRIRLSRASTAASETSA